MGGRQQIIWPHSVRVFIFGRFDEPVPWRPTFPYSSHISTIPLVTLPKTKKAPTKGGSHIIRCGGEGIRTFANLSIQVSIFFDITTCLCIDWVVHDPKISKIIQTIFATQFA